MYKINSWPFLFIFVVILAIFAIPPIEGVTDLTENPENEANFLGNSLCSSHDKCGDNALCANYTCICEFGYRPKNKIDCTRIKCKNDSECTQYYSNTTCDSYNRKCACLPYHFVDGVTQKCVRNSQLIGDTCSNDVECGGNALCSNSTCRCKLGYVANGNKFDCDQVRCNSNSECTQLSPNTECNPNYKECVCLPSYVVDSGTQNCTRKYQLIGGECSTESQCGGNALCLKSTCQCQMGYAKNPVNQMDCDQVRCSSNSQCTKLFSNTECDSFFNKCVCQSGFKLNQSTQTCDPTSQLIGQSCTSTIYKCGLNTVCAGAVCKCEMGSVPNENKVDCTRSICSMNSDCKQFSNSKCDSKKCKCKSAYEVDWLTQTCVLEDEDDDDDEEPSKVLLITFCVLAVVLFGIVLAICFYCCCPSKRRPVPPANNQPTAPANNTLGRSGQFLPSAPIYPSLPIEGSTSKGNNLYPDLQFDPPPAYSP